MGEERAGLRVLVCGGRDFRDRAAVYRVLDKLHAARGVALVIHGGAQGADTLAGDWAWERGVAFARYPADWFNHGKAAGSMRNARMLEAKPDGVVAFPGGRGTADMMRQAEAAGVNVWRPLRVPAMAEG